MPTFSENGKISYTAAAPVAQGTIVKFSGSTDAAGLPTVTPTTAANDAAIGVALMPANAGEKVAVKILGSGGTTLVLAGGAVTAGAQVAADGTATAADTDVIIGRALSAASAANEMIEVVTQVGMVK